MTKQLTLTVFLLGSLGAAQDRYRIETFAGTPAPEGVPAISTFMSSPQGLAFDSAGNLYVGLVNEAKVKRIRKGTTAIQTVAGNGLGNYGGDNGPALQAGLNAPRYVAFNAADDLYISENNSCVIRKVDHVTNTITTYAGNGTCGYGGDGGPATAAQLYLPRGIALDSTGNLYIADAYNHRVRRVDAVTHTITTVAGADPTSQIPPPYGDGGLATNARLRQPLGIAFDSGGYMYILDKNNCSVRRVDPATNIITTYAGMGPGTCGFGGDGGLATAANLSNNVRAIAFDQHDNLFLADSAYLRVRVVWRATGVIETYAGDGTFGYQRDSLPAKMARLAAPQGLAVDRNGDLFVSDWNANAIAKISHGRSPVFSLYAGSIGTDGEAKKAFLNNPAGLAVKPTGEVLISETMTGRIREVNTSGLISTVAGVGMNGPHEVCSVPQNCYLNVPDGLAADSTGSFYFAEAMNCVVQKVESPSFMTPIAGTGVCGYSGEEGLAVNVQVGSLGGITLDGRGDIAFADYGNNRVRAVNATDGLIHTLAGGDDLGYNGDGIPAQAAQLNVPYGVAMDAASTVLYIADGDNHRVRKIDLTDPQRMIYTVAGTGDPGYNGDGIATSVKLSGPSDVWLNAAGDLFIVDSGNYLVRRIKSGSDQLITIAGNYAMGPGYSGDGGPATSAQLVPNRVTGDASGHLYVSDTVSDVVRRLTPQYLLTTLANPPAGGTITPGGFFDLGAIVSIATTANLGYEFTGFSGDAGGSTNPVNVTMSSTRNVVANFGVVSGPSILGTITGSANGPGNQRIYTLLLTNVGPGVGRACQVTGLSAVTLAGNGQVNIKVKLPLLYGDLNSGAGAVNAIQANVPPSVRTFSLNAAGTCQNRVEQTLPFTTTLSVSR